MIVGILAAAMILSQLGSNQPLRDKALKRRGLQTDRYPMAVFDPTQPIAFSSAPREGQVVRTQAAAGT
jgi:hypothetical protein